MRPNTAKQWYYTVPCTGVSPNAKKIKAKKDERAEEEKKEADKQKDDANATSSRDIKSEVSEANSGE